MICGSAEVGTIIGDYSKEKVVHCKTMYSMMQKSHFSPHHLYMAFKKTYCIYLLLYLCSFYGHWTVKSVELYKSL